MAQLVLPLLAAAVVHGAILEPSTTIYLEPNFSGLSLDLGLIDSNTSLPWSHGIQSVRVASGYEFVGYESPAFRGSYMIWDRAAPDMGTLWSARILSFRVRPQTNELTIAPNNKQNIVSVYQAPTFDGGVLDLHISTGEISPPFYRNISSIRVTPGFVFVGYDGPNQTGATHSWSADSIYLDSWARRIVSYQVHPATTPPITMDPVTSVAPTPAPTPAASTNCKRAIARQEGSWALTVVDTVIILASAGGIVVLVVAIAVCVLRRVKAARQKSPLSHASTSRDTTSAAGSLQFDSIYKLAIDGSALQLDQLIGCGAFAEVWRGSFQSQVVAVKTLLSNRSTNQEIQDFVLEIALMASFESPYIVSVLGATWTRPSDLKCIMEYMNMGDLKDHLAHHGPNAYPWAQKVSAIQSIVHGLVYLHSLNIIHRDLKSRNILLDSKKGVKLVDFGVAKEDTHATMTTGVGTFRWMAPEVLQDSYYTVAADMYSFGMVLSEFDAHHIPYQNVKNAKTGMPLVDTAIIGAVMNGVLRPTFSADCPPCILDIAHACLAHDPTDRPTAFQVAAMLRDLEL
ncbi:protein kinase [Achlya hypogyna]|uniref:Protein kinase n=1 Tax=Achlya hypogyna TaxID=1202772 RepID=A0A1V9Z2F5_ACHHY|nr:protein kinase [Achlya hypogyna]